MKVLQIGKFYPPIRGGIETVAWELAEGMSRAGLRSDVLCASQHRVSSRESFASGYEVVRAASLGVLLSTSMAPAMVPALARLHRHYDLLHVHMPNPMAALAVYTVRPDIPLVVHWHSDVIRQRRAMMLYEPLQRWMLQRASAIIATSEPYVHASKSLQNCRDKVEVIPIGVSEPPPSDGTDAQRIRDQYCGRRIVFSLGRMVYYKGYEVLIDAAAELPDDCVVLVGGDGELLAHYRDLVIRKGLDAKVQFLGHISDDALPSYFEACDVFCMTSTVRAEAYGITMVEAMARGKPVVATDIEGSGVPWVNVNGETGYNMPMGRPQMLAGALRRLLENSALRYRLGAAAHERYLREFTAKLMTRRTIALYERLQAVQVSQAHVVAAVPPKYDQAIR